MNQSGLPKIYERNFLGNITLRKGFELSRNIITITLAYSVGLKKVSDTIKKNSAYIIQTLTIYLRS